MVLRSNSLQVVVPMAGLGKRFRDSGVSLPKPLISVDGSPMFMRAVRSLDGLDKDLSFFFIIRKVDEQDHSLGKVITNSISEVTLVQLDSPTRGAIETVLKVEAQLDPEAPLLVLDCDIAFRSELFNEFLNSAEYEDFDGALMYFDSTDPAYSYLSIDEANLITRIVEKQPISSKAVVGAYFFSRARTFLGIGQQIVEQFDPTRDKELFLSSAVNELVKAGARMRAIPAYFENFGTPQALLQYQQGQQTLLEIVIPCYNEVDLLPALIEKCLQIQENSLVRFVIVENGSTDNSRAILEKFAIPTLRVIYIPKNLGYGYGVHQGLLATSATLVGWAHGDMQIDFSVLSTLVSGSDLNQKAFIKGLRQGRSMKSRLFTGSMSLYMSLIFGKRLVDINGQPTIFSRSLLAEVKHPPTDFSFDLYIYALALFRGYSVQRFKVLLIERSHGSSSWNTGNIAIIKLSWQMIKSGHRIKKNLALSGKK